jgi:ribosomal protein S18 acetylase RimI-like enzyme
MFLHEKKVVFRDLIITDLYALHKIFMRLSEESKRFYHPHYFSPKTGIKWILSIMCFSFSSFRILRKILMRFYPNAVFLGIVALDNRKIIGLCYLKLKGKLDEGYHSDFGILVAEGYRGQGVGSKLTAEILKMSIKNNIKKIELEVLQDNQTACKLYQKYGFKITGSISKKENWKGKEYDIYQMSNYPVSIKPFLH